VFLPKEDSADTAAAERQLMVRNDGGAEATSSLRCTMYDAMWQLCTDAMATLAISAEACLHMHVALFDALSLGSDSVFTLPCAQKHQTAVLVASSAICGSVPCEWSSACP